MLLAIRAASRGELYLSPAITDTVLADFLAQPGGTAETERFDRLSPRESQVLQLIAEGRSNAFIGRALHLSPKTVETHVAAVFAKLGLVPDPDDNRRVLAALAWLRAGRPPSG